MRYSIGAFVGVLKKVDDADYSGYIKRKLVEWYKLVSKSDRHARMMLLAGTRPGRSVAKRSMRMGERGGQWGGDASEFLQDV